MTFFFPTKKANMAKGSQEHRASVCVFAVFPAVGIFFPLVVWAADHTDKKAR